MIARMKRTGVVIVGKTNCAELGILGVTEPELRGPARNPWNPDHTPGGSSGGTAAIVAARAVPMGHGGDGGGSIRIPSSACGLFGLKPTRGRNPLGPQVGEGWGGYVQHGVLTRSVRDCATMLDATQGPDVGRAVRVAAARAAVRRGDPARAAQAPHRVLDRLAARARAPTPTSRPRCTTPPRCARASATSSTEVALPIDREALVAAYFTQIAVGAAERRSRPPRAGSAARRRADDFEPTTWLLGTIGRKLPAIELQHARDACQAAGRQLGRFFAGSRPVPRRHARLSADRGRRARAQARRARRARRAARGVPDVRARPAARHARRERAREDAEHAGREPDRRSRR